MFFFLNLQRWPHVPITQLPSVAPSHKGMFLGIEAAGDAQTTQLLGVFLANKVRFGWSNNG